jgi:hypothetical protein
VVTDKLAIILGSLILAAIAADLLANGGQAMMFLLKKFADMVEWLAFWR